MTESPLFRPFAGGGLSSSNRLVMAPMTRRFSPGGVPTEAVAAYYQRRAQANVGLLVTEGTWIDHISAANSHHVPRMYGDDALKGWAAVVAAVHGVGGRIAAQLWHVGALAADSTSDFIPPRIVSPSGFYRPGQIVGDPISLSEIQEVVNAYARAALAAKETCFDAVEFHGAHGYLIDQFFWSQCNRRDDGYGGTLRQRTRFAVEVIRESRRLVGPDFPLIFRLSQFKFEHYDYKLAGDPRMLTELVEPLAAAGVSIFHCSQRRYWEPEFPDSGSALNLAGWVKKLTGLPTITVGSVGLADRGDRVGTVSLERAEEMLERGEIDLVAVGRSLLQDPLWANKVRAGETPLPYDSQALERLS
jgi:2,4-dienoyl-CoA reductase-like NADH-dependent reductase (Old Yellow Enzyme family)